MSITDQPKIGPRRVASWIYEVINPLLEAIPIEVSFLEKRNPTWRFYNRELEHLRPVSGYLTHDGRHVLRDFQRAFRPDEVIQFSSHDDRLEDVCRAAEQAHGTLIAREEFVQRAREALREFMSAGQQHGYPGGSFPEERFPELVAERVVNSIVHVPSNHTDADFWRQYGAGFLRFREGDVFQKLDSVCTTLLENDRKFLEWLENKSFELCTRYDVPAAPLHAAFE